MLSSFFLHIHRQSSFVIPKKNLFSIGKLRLKFKRWRENKNSKEQRAHEKNYSLVHPADDLDEKNIRMCSENFDMKLLEEGYLLTGTN